MQSFFNNNDERERLEELTNTIFETLINELQSKSRYLTITPDLRASLRDAVYKLVKIASQQNKLLLQFPAVLAYFVYNFLKNISLDRLNYINEKLDDLQRLIQRKNLQGLSFNTIKQMLQQELQEKKFRPNKQQGEQKQSGNGEKQQEEGEKQEGEEGEESQGEQGQELEESEQENSEEQGQQEGEEQEGEQQGEEQGSEEESEEQQSEGNQEEEGETQEGEQESGEEVEEQGSENEGEQGEESVEEGEEESGEEGNEGEQGNVQEGEESEGESGNEESQNEEESGEQGQELEGETQEGEEGQENENEGQNGGQGEESQEGTEQEQSGNEGEQGEEGQSEEGGEQGEGIEEGEEQQQGQESGEGEESESEGSQSGGEEAELQGGEQQNEGEEQENENEGEQGEELGESGNEGEQQSENEGQNGEQGEESQSGEEGESQEGGEQQGGEEGNQEEEGQNGEQGQESEGGEGQEIEDIMEDLENNIDEESEILDELEESLQKSLSALSIGEGSGGGILKEVNPRVLELLDRANRMLALANQVDLEYANRGVKDQGGVMKGITTGNNLKHMFKSQLLLPDEIFLERYTNRALLQRAVENEGVGDLYFMIDKSGSMLGEMPNGYTAFENVSAVALASAMEAEKNNKKVFVQYFDDLATEPMDVNNVFELAQIKPGGGTDMMVALRKFMEYYNNYPGLKDVKQIFILSDFETNYDKQTLQDFKNFARNNDLIVTCLHVWGDEVPNEMQYIIDQICDEYYKFNNYDASELFSAVYSKV
ncbi:hypothetical protein [Sulfolobus monocaudavirus SMV4]|uniref:hypothetical protein n=1 Tax=Sulfolobus monocaudavirus SMV4 TaxID=1732178 RepID=UPI00070652BF|nr:hypothetical protein AVT99_gp23 [Sulfolobus monocaudavirus SMV4]ALG97047.1 hypothetical protein [Sulfolobus monocaudavirus SMV4]